MQRFNGDPISTFVNRVECFICSQMDQRDCSALVITRNKILSGSDKDDREVQNTLISSANCYILCPTKQDGGSGIYISSFILETI